MLMIIIEKVQNYILTMWGEDEGIWKTMPPKERKLTSHNLKKDEWMLSQLYEPKLDMALDRCSSSHLRMEQKPRLLMEEHGW